MGTVVANYTYDSWGNHVSITDGGGNDVSADASHVANINPFRYRGYYFDSETGLYYLNSRYYDSTVGRFLNADGYVSTGQGSVGNNMFAYCRNNPIIRIDPNGQEDDYAIMCANRAAWMGEYAYNATLEAMEEEIESSAINADKPLTSKEMEHNAELIFDYLSYKGWSFDAICAALGNFQRESYINSGYRQRGGGKGFGVAQWDPSTKYTDWARENGYSDDSLIGQLVFLEYSSQPGRGEWFRNNKHPEYYLKYNVFVSSTDYSIEFLTKTFLWSYERAGVEAVQERIKYARNWAEYFS